VQILFGGDTFPSSRALLQPRLPNDELSVWPDPSVLAPTKGRRVDVLIPMMFRIDARVMDALRPRLIQQWGSGLEGVALEAARARGIPVANVPASGSNADSVAEHALLLMLALLRQFPLAQANVRAGVLGSPLGSTLAGRTVGLWGLGATALALARRLRGLEVRLLGLTRDPKAAKVAAFGLDECYSMQDGAACFGEIDILVLCVRSSPETRAMVNERTLSMLRPGAYLVNAARGALVDYGALFRALASGRLAGAALDVFWEEPIRGDDPLLALPNVIATPHVAGVTDRSYEEIAAAVAANIERLRRGADIANRAA
jgi:phosphoglycerate dehydrogenase-like enzyme